MKGTVNIGGVAVEMTANAASTFIYGKIFHEDFEQVAPQGNTDTWKKMMFVMAAQSETDEMELYKGKVTETDFLKWISKFEYMDILDAVDEASNLFVAQKKTKSRPKAKAE